LLIKNLKNNENVKKYFLIVKKELLKTKTEKNYLNLILQDKSGKIEGKIWDVNENIDIDEGDVVLIEGKVDKFKDKLQIIINSIVKIDDKEEHISELVPATEKNLNKLITQLTYFKDSISNQYLKKLVEKVLFDEKFFAKFKLAPAASKFHHAYRGGLLEHTINVVEICDKLSSIYSFTNKDILITGALLHDIGKVYEYDLLTFSRTDYGKLVGHIGIGLSLIDRKLEKFKNFPEKLAHAIRHLILSHHGEFEWGSPVQPLTIEALLLHFADNIDSKAFSFYNFINEKKGWVYSSSLRRNILFDDYNDDLADSKLISEKIKSIFD